MAHILSFFSFDDVMAELKLLFHLKLLTNNRMSDAFKHRIKVPGSVTYVLSDEISLITEGAGGHYFSCTRNGHIFYTNFSYGRPRFCPTCFKNFHALMCRYGWSMEAADTIQVFFDRADYEF